MLSEKYILKIRNTANGSEQRLVFKTLGDTNRYRIFEMLGKEERLAVSDIAKILKISLPLASQHLKILSLAKILQKDRQGQKVFYKLAADNKTVQSITKWVI